MITDTGLNINSLRILIIDDNAAIHEDFRKILGMQTNTDTKYDEMKKILFALPTGKGIKKFRMDSAFQGKDGFEMIKNAIVNNDPYALAFVDILMPPGWDGIETLEHVLKADPNIQIVLCTASSSYSQEDIIRSLGQSDRLLFLRKPFDSMEACQLAYSLTEKWRLSREVDEQIEVLKKLLTEQTTEFDKAFSELNKTNKILKIIFEATNDAVFLIDEKFNIILYNPIVSERYGYSNDELSKMNIVDFHLNEDKETVKFQMSNMIERGEDMWKTTHVRKNGSKFTVKINITNVTVDNKVKFIGIVSDITRHT